MSNFFARRGAVYINEMNQSLGALVGIAQGVLSDQHLNDNEIHYLNEWLSNNEVISTSWPGDVIHQRVRSVIADGVITDDERKYLVKTLQQLIGGALDELAESTHVTELAFDDVSAVEFEDASFCLTGNFVFGPKRVCKSFIEERGGVVTSSITKKLNYLVIGGLGSSEWKHGSFGTKVEKAMDYKNKGVPILIVHEDLWANSL
jgi:NAD-dependent DNA ligase